VFNGEPNAAAATSAADRNKHAKRAMTDVCVRVGVMRSTAAASVMSLWATSLGFIGAPRDGGRAAGRPSPAAFLRISSSRVLQY